MEPVATTSYRPYATVTPIASPIPTLSFFADALVATTIPLALLAVLVAFSLSVPSVIVRVVGSARRF